MCDDECDNSACAYDGYDCYYYEDNSIDIDLVSAETEAKTEKEKEKDEEKTEYSIWALLAILIIGYMAYKKMRQIKASIEANKPTEESAEYVRL